MPVKRYLVTGGCGFIGSHLIDRLLDEGEVIAIDDLSSGRREFVEHHAGKSGFMLVEEDILNTERIAGLFKGIGTVFHCAANPDARMGNEQTDLDLRLETLATHSVLECMRQGGVRDIVFPSSGTVCGDVLHKPVPEDYGPCLPISLYGAGKLACEGMISAYCHLFGMKAWIFRFANIIGPRATHGVIYDLVRKYSAEGTRLEVLGDGKQEKPYLHVSDCVDAIITVWQRADEQVNLFNVGCLSTTTVKKIAEKVAVSMGGNSADVEYTGTERGWPGDVSWFQYDTRKLREYWQCPRTSDEAVDLALQEIIKEQKCRR